MVLKESVMLVACLSLGGYRLGRRRGMKWLLLRQHMQSLLQSTAHRSQLSAKIL